MNSTKNNWSILALVRHGESEWNAKGLWTGWTDIGLSENGKLEARKAAYLLKGINFDIAISSNLKRAIQTLEIILTDIHRINIPIYKSEEFNERNYGDFTAKNKWQMKKLLGEEEFLRVRRGWDVPIPNGETLKDVYMRVIKGYEKLIKPAIYEGKKILLSAHGNSLRALVKYLENIPDEMISRLEIATGESLVYYFDKESKVIDKKTLSTVNVVLTNK